MSDMQIISASLQGLTTAISSAATSVMTTVKTGVDAYKERTQEMAKRTALLDKLTMGGQSLPMHVVIQPAPIEPPEATVDGTLGEAVEEAASKEGQGEQPPAAAPGGGQQG